MSLPVDGYGTEMIFFFRRRLRRYLLLVVALPLIGHLLVRMGATMEDKYGPGGAAVHLQRSGDFLLRHTERPRSRGFGRRPSM